MDSRQLNFLFIGGVEEIGLSMFWFLWALWEHRKRGGPTPNPPPVLWGKAEILSGTKNIPENFSFLRWPGVTFLKQSLVWAGRMRIVLCRLWGFFFIGGFVVGHK